MVIERSKRNGGPVKKLNESIYFPALSLYESSDAQLSPDHHSISPVPSTHTQDSCNIDTFHSSTFIPSYLAQLASGGDGSGGGGDGSGSGGGDGSDGGGGGGSDGGDCSTYTRRGVIVPEKPEHNIYKT